MSRKLSLRSPLVRFYPYTSLRAFNRAKRESGRRVADAVRRGELTKGCCEVCGRKMVEAHHDDHEKPLEVRWLCRLHHRQRDAILREERVRLGVVVPIRPVEAQPAASEIVRRSNARYLKHPETGRGLVLDATMAVAAAMDADGVNCSELSRRLGSSRQCVASVFAGGIRSLRSLAGIADALGYDVHVSLSRRHQEVA